MEERSGETIEQEQNKKKHIHDNAMMKPIIFMLT